MYLGVKSVEPLKDYKLKLVFENNEIRLFDMISYMDTGLFKQLENKKIFDTVHVSFDTIEWDNGLDICPEILYKDSIPIKD